MDAIFSAPPARRVFVVIWQYGEVRSVTVLTRSELGHWNYTREERPWRSAPWWRSRDVPIDSATAEDLESGYRAETFAQVGVWAEDVR